LHWAASGKLESFRQLAVWGLVAGYNTVFGWYELGSFRLNQSAGLRLCSQAVRKARSSCSTGGFPAAAPTYSLYICSVKAAAAAARLQKAAGCCTAASECSRKQPKVG